MDKSNDLNGYNVDDINNDTDNNINNSEISDTEAKSGRDLDLDFVEYEYSVDLSDIDKKAQESDKLESDVRKKRRDRYATKMEIYDWIQCIVSALVCGILVFVFFARILGIDGYSMYKTLTNNDRVIVSNLFYKPEHGDVVIIKTDYFGNTPIVKRIIATEGQTVDIDFDSGIVYVDGKALEEEYVNGSTNVHEDFSGPVTVPEGHVFVMGDNRNESTDSRDDRVGFVDTRCILGKVYFILIPGHDDVRGIETDWSRIGSIY